MTNHAVNVVTLILTTPFLHAQNSDDVVNVVEVCENVATLSQANLDLMRSANGTFELTTEALFDAPGEKFPIQSWSSEIDFTADLAGGRYFSDYRVLGLTERRSVDGEQQDQVSDGNRRDLAIVTSEDFIWLQAYDRPLVAELPAVDGLTEEGGRMAIRLQSTDSENETMVGRVFDLRQIWSDLPRFFGQYHSELTSDDSAVVNALDVVAENAGTPDKPLIRVTHTYPDPGVPLAEKSRNVFLIDPRIWHVIHWEYYETGGVMTKEFDWKYEPQADGILFPVVFSQVLNKLSNGQRQPWLNRLFTVKSVELNKPIDEGRFEIAALGLQYGERLHDKIQGKMFIMDREGMVPAEDFRLHRDKVHERKHDSLSLLWWGLGAVIVILVIATIVRRKRVLA